MIALMLELCVFIGIYVLTFVSFLKCILYAVRYASGLGLERVICTVVEVNNELLTTEYKFRGNRYSLVCNMSNGKLLSVGDKFEAWLDPAFPDVLIYKVLTRKVCKRRFIIWAVIFFLLIFMILAMEISPSELQYIL